jgi:hypothetical protein
MTLINLEDVQNIILFHMQWYSPSDDYSGWVYIKNDILNWINSLPTHDPIAVLKDMIEECNNAKSIWESFTHWIATWTLEEAISRITNQ